MEPRLIDVIHALEKRGRNEEAELCRVLPPLLISLLHGFTEERVMRMTINEVERWIVTPPRPPQYDGWNTFYWGKAAFQ